MATNNKLVNNERLEHYNTKLTGYVKRVMTEAEYLALTSPIPYTIYFISDTQDIIVAGVKYGAVGGTRKIEITKDTETTITLTDEQIDYLRHDDCSIILTATLDSDIGQRTYTVNRRSRNAINTDFIRYFLCADQLKTVSGSQELSTERLMIDINLAAKTLKFLTGVDDVEPGRVYTDNIQQTLEGDITFTKCPSCAVLPILDNELANKNYVDNYNATFVGVMDYKGVCLQANLPTTDRQNGDYWTLSDAVGSIYYGQCAVWNSKAVRWDYSASNITVDASLNKSSTNPVQNKIVTAALNSKVGLTGNQTIAGNKTFSGNTVINGTTTTKNTTINGTLTVTGATTVKSTLTSTNKITGTIFTATTATSLIRNVDSDSLFIEGGTTNKTGAYLRLYGKSANSGNFQLSACDGTTTCSLVSDLANKDLLWNGKSLLLTTVTYTGTTDFYHGISIKSLGLYVVGMKSLKIDGKSVSVSKYTCNPGYLQEGTDWLFLFENEPNSDYSRLQYKDVEITLYGYEI